MKHTTLVIAVIAFLCPARSHGYEVDTHQRITKEAVARSQLTTALEALGIDPERKLAADSAPTVGWSSATPHDWLVAGSAWEDGFSKCASRPKNHFYNPLNDEGLSDFGISLGHPSLAWGLEVPQPIAGQEFSLGDGREYLWEALTRPTGTERMDRLANLFRSVGQVVHLIEDLAQPQHTRNDPHAGLRCSANLFGVASAFEKWAHDSAREPGFGFGSYPNVDLDRPSEFWTHPDGKGLADFSNRSFVSHGTNYRGTAADFTGAAGFPSPGRLNSFVLRENAANLVPGAEGVVEFVANTFTDELTGETFTNLRAATWGLYDDDLKRRGQPRRFSLNRFNYAEMVFHLIPRAVGYAAGFIDHFFRGTIEVQPPLSYAYSAAPYVGGLGTFDRLRARIRNSTEGEQAGEGTLHAIVRYRTSDGNLLENPDAPLHEEESYAISAAQVVALGDELTEFEFDFSATPIPVNAADVHLTIAFRGPLTKGQVTEDAILLGGKDLYEPDRIRIANMTDYACKSGQLHDVATVSPAGRDVDGDGTRDLFGPNHETVNYVSVNGEDGTGPGWPWEGSHHFRIDDLEYARYGSFAILQDAPRYLVLNSGIGIDTFGGNQTYVTLQLNAVAQVNRVLYTPQGSVREILMHATTHRGSRGLDCHLLRHLGKYWVDPPSAPCWTALANVPRPIVEEEGTVNAFAEPEAAS